MSHEEMQSRIIQMEVDMGITKTELIDVLREIEITKREMGDAVEREFANVKTRLDNLLNDTSRDMHNLSEANKELLNRTARAVDTGVGKQSGYGWWRRKREGRKREQTKRISSI